MAIITDDLTRIDEILWEIKTVTKGKFKSYELLNLITFDIETSNGHFYNGRVLPYIKDMYKSEDYNKRVENISLMYMWQMAIESAKEIYVFIGRTYEELEKFIKGIVARLNFLKGSWRTKGRVKKEALIKSKQKKNKAQLTANIFIHNLSFEFQHLLNIESFKESAMGYTVSNNGKIYRNVFARNSREPLRVKYKDPTFDGVEMHFRDTYALTNQSLKMWAIIEELGEQKIEKTSEYYNIIRTPKTELTAEEVEYAAQDVIVMIAGLRKYIAEYHTPSDIPMTATGIVRKHAAQAVHANRKNTEAISEAMDKYNLDFYSHLLAAFQGGYTHANAIRADQVLEGVESFDFASAYPSVMVGKKFPIGPFEEVEGADKELEFRALNTKKYNYILKVYVEGVVSKQSMSYWSLSKVINGKNLKADNGRVISMESGTMIMTELDWAMYQRTYSIERASIVRLWRAETGYLPVELREYVLELYRKKTEYKGVEGKEEEYKQAKVRLNSLYGAIVMKQGKGLIIYDEDGWYEEEVTDEIFKEKINEADISALIAAYQVGVWITAWTRYNLWTLIMQDPDAVCYCDTDSIKGLFKESDKKAVESYNKKWIKEAKKSLKDAGISEDLLEPKTPKGVKKPLGIFDYEGKYENFKTLGAKRYAYTEDGETHAVISGLPKKARFDSIDDFYDGRTFERDESYKSTATYNDNQTPTEWEDYKGGKFFSDCKYGICITPATFDLSMGADFKQVIQLYAKAFVTGDFSEVGSLKNIFKERIR